MRILLDPGHGGSDPGAEAGAVREADLVLDYGKELRRILEGRGHRVSMSRTEDIGVTLRARTDQANTLGVDCFVSVHANASVNAEAHGFQVFHYLASKQGRSLALNIMAAVRPVVGSPRWAGVFTDDSPQTGNRRLHVLRATRMPAVLVELGFLTHPAEHAALTSPDYRDRLCSALAYGIEAWAGVVYPELLGEPWVKPQQPTIPDRVEHSSPERLKQMRADATVAAASVPEPQRRQFVLDMALAALTHEYASKYIPGWILKPVTWALRRLGAE